MHEYSLQSSIALNFLGMAHNMLKTVRCKSYSEQNCENQQKFINSMIIILKECEWS